MKAKNGYPKLNAALVKSPKGRVYIAMTDDLPQHPCGVIYYSNDDVMALSFDDGTIAAIAHDMDLEFSTQLKEQQDIALVSVTAGSDPYLRLPLSIR